MRVLLQNAETKHYFVSPNDWTNDPLKATDFGEVETAAQVYLTQDVAFAQIVFEPGLPTPRTEPKAEFFGNAQLQG